VNKDGTDWSGAFGDDPTKYASGHPLADSDSPSSDDEDDSSGTVDLGIQDGDNPPDEPGVNGSGPRQSMASATTFDSTATGNTNKQNKRTEERKHRGLNQWKPMRNVVFARDQTKIGMSKLKKKITGGLDGRQPGVETEIGN